MRDLNKVENEPEDLEVPHIFASIGISSGLRTWWENICLTAPVPSPLNEAKRLLNSKVPENKHANNSFNSGGFISLIALTKCDIHISCLSEKSSCQYR